MTTAPTPLLSSAAEKAWSSFSSASTKPSTKHSPSAFLLIKSIANRWLLTLRARHAANFGRLRLQARIPALRRNSVRALEERLQEMEQRLREVSTETERANLSK